MAEANTISRRLDRILENLDSLRNDAESPSCLLPANSSRPIIRAKWYLEDLKSILSQTSETTSDKSFLQTSSPDLLKSPIGKKIAYQESIEKSISIKGASLQSSRHDVYVGGQLITGGDNVQLKFGVKKVPNVCDESKNPRNKGLETEHPRNEDQHRKEIEHPRNEDQHRKDIEHPRNKGLQIKEIDDPINTDPHWNQMAKRDILRQAAEGKAQFKLVGNQMTVVPSKKSEKNDNPGKSVKFV